MPRQPQPNEPFDEPPFEQIRPLSRRHVRAMETTTDDAAWIVAGMHHVMVSTVGRRSGTEHKVPLPVWFDDDGHRVVVASCEGSDRHPDWYLNLADKSVNPTVKVRTNRANTGQSPRFWRAANTTKCGSGLSQSSVLRRLPDSNHAQTAARASN